MSRILLNSSDTLQADLSNIDRTAFTNIVQEVSPPQTVANVGTGEGNVWRDTVADVINLKTIKQGTGLTVTDNADDITLSVSGGGLAYQGTWDANTNTPTLVSSTGTAGHYYIVSVAGTTLLNGINEWGVDDFVLFSDTGVWQKLDHSQNSQIPSTQVNIDAIGAPTYTTLSQSLGIHHSTGKVVGGGITDNLNGTVSVASGEGFIRGLDDKISTIYSFGTEAHLL